MKTLIPGAGISIAFLTFSLMYWVSGCDSIPEQGTHPHDREYVGPGLIRNDCTAVILSLGQSNAASSGQGVYQCKLELQLCKTGQRENAGQDCRKDWK
jgi:hypothetical protein